MYAPFPAVVSVGGSARDCLTGANVREANEVLQPHGLSPGCARPTFYLSHTESLDNRK